MVTAARLSSRDRQPKIDVTIVTVALPEIERSFHASASGLQWTVDAYTLVLACLLMLSGSLADRFGRRPLTRPPGSGP